MKKLLCIIGPTATGKTDAALELAKKFNGELVACDSRQVYTGLDLGTGKEPSNQFLISKEQGYWIVDGIKVWMYDVVSPTEQYSVSQYILDATKIIEKIVDRHKLPIVVGGTGLYLDGLLNGVETSNIGPNEKLRQQLEKLSLDELQQQLAKIAPQQFGELNNSEKHNQRRLIRKIEIALKVGSEQWTVNRKKQGLGKMFEVLKIGLTAPREVLNQRITKRAWRRTENGMIDEAQFLLKNELTLDRMRQLGLEYAVLADLLEGRINKSEFVQVLAQKIKQFAKRQLTWFKRDKEIVWVDITEENYADKVEDLVKNWYNSPEKD